MVVWDKGPIGMGWHYRRSYETVLVAMKPGAACKWFDTTQKIENIIRPGYRGIRKIIPTADDHPTPKPPELAAHFIKLHSKPGDIILDCFSGRGSSLAAAQNMGRDYIGIELDPLECELAERRVKRETAQMNMFTQRTAP
jgi:DNA modification methylase